MKKLLVIFEKASRPKLFRCNDKGIDICGISVEEGFINKIKVFKIDKGIKVEIKEL